MCSSLAMAVPQNDSFRLVSDYKAVNKQVEKSPCVMPNQEADKVDLLSARFFCLSDVRRPETAAELMRFLQAMNWLRTSPPRMAEVVAPLRLFLEELMAGAARRTQYCCD